VDAGVAGCAQAGIDRAHIAQARLHARRYRRCDRISVRRHQHGDAQTLVVDGGYSL
jgi:hypothetical protein